jgi:RNA recognition motif-containing protein
MTNPENGLSKGIALVRLTNEADATTAISRLNFSQHDGQVISVRRDLHVKREYS